MRRYALDRLLRTLDLLAAICPALTTSNPYQRTRTRLIHALSKP